MKKIYSLISICAISSSSIFAQVLPNSGFESWTNTPASFPAPAYDTPNSWNTLNSTTAGVGQITCVKATALADIHSGSAAIKLITKSVFGQVANGIATTGTINTSSQTIGGGIAYTGRPDSIAGWFKYTPVTGDNGFVELQLLGSGGDTDTVGYVRFKTPTTTVGSYTHFSKKIIYRNSNPVVKSIWILSSSADAVTHFANSTLWVDDLQVLTATAAGITEQPKLELTVGPNPTSNFIFIKNPDSKNLSLKMYDVTGRMIMEQRIDNVTNTIEVNSLPIGLYMYAISDDSKRIIKTGKIIIQK
jgi:hypothetical protein